MDHDRGRDSEHGGQIASAPAETIAAISPGQRVALQVVFVALFIAVLAVVAAMVLPAYSRLAGAVGNPDAALMAGGRLAGLLAGAMLMLQFVLGSRLKPLDGAFGLDRVLRFHRITGVTAIGLALLHPILLYVTPHYSFDSETAAWKTGLGSLAMLALFVIAVTSIWRKSMGLSYETWHRFHYLGFAVVVLIGTHSLVLGSDLHSGWARWIWMAMLGGYALLFVWARVVRPRVIAARGWTVEHVSPVSHNTWQLELAPEGHAGLRQVPGQFALLTLQRKGARDERHPFTVASAPREDGSISFAIKESGDYTSDIGGTPEGAHAIVEGPYGQFCHLRHGGDRLLMIAGGVGITPILSMLRYMAAEEDARPVTLIWGNRTEEDILYREEIEQMAKSLDLRVVHVLSEQLDFEGEIGHVDEQLLRRLLNGEDADAAVYLCGPPPMMKLVRRALREVGFKPSQVHSERFEF